MVRRVANEDQQVQFEAMTCSLAEGGVLAPLADRDEDAQLWMDCDLCSLIENRFYHQLEPASVTPEHRTAWTRRVLDPDEPLWDPRRSEFAAAFWLIDRGVRAGTLAWSTAPLHHQFLTVFSLYVFPAHRAAGLAVVDPNVLPLKCASAAKEADAR